MRGSGEKEKEQVIAQVIGWYDKVGMEKYVKHCIPKGAEKRSKKLQIKPSSHTQTSNKISVHMKNVQYHEKLKMRITNVENADVALFGVFDLLHQTACIHSLWYLKIL